MLFTMRFKRNSRLPANLQNRVPRHATLPCRRQAVTWHTSPTLKLAVLAIAVVVGWTLFLTGGMTGQSFGINAVTTPSPRYGESMKGFEFGPYATPFDKNRFLEVQQQCSPNRNSRFQNFPPDQHECCRLMCNDACYAYNDQRPGACLLPCLKGCMTKSAYTIT